MSDDTLSVEIKEKVVVRYLKLSGDSNVTVEVKSTEEGEE